MTPSLPSRRRIYRIALVVALVGLILDQVSKWYLLNIVAPDVGPQGVDILPFFRIVFWSNDGTSFSLFRTSAAWGPYVFSIAALVIVGLLVLWLSRVANPVTAAAIGAVIGGALGNVVDRLRLGTVSDFFYVHLASGSSACRQLDSWFQTCGWPAFNVADSFIVVGMGVLIFDGMFVSGKTTKTIG